MKIDGKPTKSVIISVVTLVTDVILDLFLIYGLLGIPKLGSNGSAYSTVAVEFIALVWCIVESYKKDSIRPDLKGFKWFSKDITKDYLKILLPMLFSNLAWGLSISIHSFVMGHLGSDATASSSIAAVMLDMVTCVCKGVSAGAGIIIGKLLGQNLFEKAKIYGRKLCYLSFIIGIIQMILLCISGPIISMFFVLTETARKYLIIMLIFTGIEVIAYSFNTVIVCGIFPAGGDARYDAISVLFATWCFSLPVSLLGAFVFNWPVTLVYVIMCLDEIVKVPFIFPRYKKYLWLKNLTKEQSDG
ncbi:MAG: polysaccharide biosynthesis C-terminal domain-containing protein [Clostridia bacterium]|nr:polysaccharide biosynthesis C-terminal domain-containing protein [Clostridia bacterium]